MLIQRLVPGGAGINIFLSLLLFCWRWQTGVAESATAPANDHLATPTKPSAALLLSSMVVTDEMAHAAHTELWPEQQQSPGLPVPSTSSSAATAVTSSTFLSGDQWLMPESMWINTFQSVVTPHIASQDDSSATYDPHNRSESSTSNEETMVTTREDDIPMPRRAHPESTWDQNGLVTQSRPDQHDEEEEGGFPVDVHSVGIGISPEVVRANRRLDEAAPHHTDVPETVGVVAETTPGNVSLDDQKLVADNRTRDLLNASSPVQVEHTEPADPEDGNIQRMTVVLPTALGVSALLLMATGAALYRWRLRGRRRKVYFGGGPHGTTATAAKDFAEDRGVRGPVLLPDEIEMQVARSSLRARKALVLTSDVVSGGDGTGTDDDSGERTPDSPPPPPPPPYRSPPPYLPDVIIQNVHAS